MLRISANTNNISCIKWFTKDTIESGYDGNLIDSFVIIPGVTQYQHIYTKDNWIVFDSSASYIGVGFNSQADLERYFVKLLREIKLNQITNVSVDVDTKTK